MSFDRLRDFIASEPAERRAGEQLGRYVLIEPIGAGGMSVVWRARDPELERVVAIKVLRAGDVDRLRREAVAAARLRHPNIVVVHEVGPDYIVMDLVEGRTLAEAMPAMSRDQRLRALTTVARAVDHAHRNGVVHRDLKPANILVDGAGRVVLTDFGLAQLGGVAGDTQPGTVMGTPGYMAPEQVRGESQGAAVDVWALGVLLYEALADRPPFQAPTLAALYDAIVRGSPAPLPGAGGAVVARALEKQAARRYGTAAELADDLERVARGERVRRVPLATIAPALVVAGALSLVIGTIAVERRRSAPRESAPATASQPGWSAEEQRLERALAARPDDAELLLARAELRRARADDGRDRGRNPLNDYAAAEADASRALALTESTAARFARAVVRVQRASYKVRYGLDPVADCDAAEQDLRGAGGGDGVAAWVANARFLRGWWRERSGLDARSDFEAAERAVADARGPEALTRRGRARMHLGRHAEADADFAAALAAMPHDAWTWTWRGMASARAGDAVTAERHYARAIAARPTHAEAWEHRGLLRLGRGDRARAAADLAEAIRLNPALEPLLAGHLRRAREGSADRP